MEKLYTVSEVRTMLRMEDMDDRTFCINYLYGRNPIITSVKLGKKRLIPQPDIDAFIKLQTIKGRTADVIGRR